MRIAYVARWDVSRESGVLKKIAAQIRAWMARGHEVRLFVMSPGDHVWEEVRDLPIEAFHRDGFLTRLLWRKRISEPILAYQPDVVYYRFSTFYPAMDRVQTNLPSIVEINSNDLVEYPLVYSPILYRLHRLTRSRPFRQSAGFVFVTTELAHDPNFAVFGKPFVVIGNSIDLARYPALPAPAHSAPRLLFIGTPGCPWHGVDKLLSLAAASPDFKFDVVGYSATDVRAPSLPNLTLHGPLSGREYRRLLENTDVAIGTLALHRNAMNEASTLKTREYLAHGIPTIIAYRETDFPNGHPLLLQLPNSPSNVENCLDTIREFVNKAAGQRIPRADVEHLDSAIKEERRLEFLERIARDTDRGTVLRPDQS